MITYSKDAWHALLLPTNKRRSCTQYHTADYCVLQRILGFYAVRCELRAKAHPARMTVIARCGTLPPLQRAACLLRTAVAHLEASSESSNQRVLPGTDNSSSNINEIFKPLLKQDRPRLPTGAIHSLLPPPSLLWSFTINQPCRRSGGPPCVTLFFGERER